MKRSEMTKKNYSKRFAVVAASYVGLVLAMLTISSLVGLAVMIVQQIAGLYVGPTTSYDIRWDSKSFVTDTD